MLFPLILLLALLGESEQSEVGKTNHILFRSAICLTAIKIDDNNKVKIWLKKNLSRITVYSWIVFCFVFVREFLISVFYLSD